MKISTLTSRITASAIAITLLSSASIAQALPTSFERELKGASKVQVGQKVSLAAETCKLVRGPSLRLRCSLSKFDVTVNSFQFKEMRNSIGFDEHTYAVDVTLENYSKEDIGLDVGALLRCSNSNLSSSFYAEGLNPQNVLGRSQLAGVIIASFPSDVTAVGCKNPTLWLSLSSSGVNPKDKKAIKKAKKRKMSAVAYIPLTDSQLNVTSDQLTVRKPSAPIIG